jgi:hypothetical protein
MFLEGFNYLGITLINTKSDSKQLKLCNMFESHI